MSGFQPLKVNSQLLIPALEPSLIKGLKILENKLSDKILQTPHQSL